MSNLPRQAQRLARKSPPDPVLHPRKYASTNRTVVSASELAILPELSALPLDHTNRTAGTGISLPYYTAREQHLLPSESLPGHTPQAHPAGFPTAVPEMSANVPTTESTAFPTAVPLTMPSIPVARPMNVVEEEMIGSIVDPGGYTGNMHSAMHDDVRQYAPVPTAPSAPVAPPSFMAKGKMMDTAAINTACTVGKEALASLTSQGYGGLIDRQKPAMVPGKWVSIEDVEDKKDQGIIGALLQIVEARTMLDHFEAFGNAEHGITWDAPPVLLTGREAMRCMVYAAKSAAEMTFDTSSFKKDTLDVNKGIHKLYLQVIFHVMPKGLLRLLLPKDIPIQADVAVTVVRDRAEPMDSPGRIQAIVGRWHNLPMLPLPIRFFNALAMGHFLHTTERIWSAGLHLLPFGADDSYLHHGLGAEKPL